jgi:hypothetical protein
MPPKGNRKRRRSSSRRVGGRGASSGVALAAHGEPDYPDMHPSWQVGCNVAHVAVLITNLVFAGCDSLPQAARRISAKQRKEIRKSLKRMETGEASAVPYTEAVQL